MWTSEQASRVTLGDVVSALASVVTFGGYLLVVGAVVAWLDVRTIGVPALSVVADMPRNELLGLGFETLAVWLLLGLIFAAAIVGIGATVEEDPVSPLTVLTASTVIAGLFAWIWQFDSVAISVAASVGLAALAVVLAFVGGRKLEISDEPIPAGIAAIVGVALGVGLELLFINPGKVAGFIAAVVALFVALLSATEMFWRHGLTPAGWYVEDAISDPSHLTGPEARSELERVAQLRNSRRRSVAMVLLLAVVLAWGAIESRKSRDFWVARVTMTNGTCVSGTLLVRDSNEVLLAGRAGRTARGQVENRLIEIPASVVSNVQVIGPPGPARPIRAESCAKAASSAYPEPFAPYPLVGESSAPESDPPVSAVPGPEAKEGKRGPEGERGPEGKHGAEGKRGHKGETGMPGPPGKTGQTGKTGSRGKTGPIGNTGPTGKTGVTGNTGARGERGPKGDRGERGPRGFSSIDGT